MTDDTPSLLPAIPDADELRAAALRVAPLVHRTPVMTSGALDAITGVRLFFKCENLQKVGAFKFRGAVNAVLSLSDDEARRGVATHSSGNHAQALALAARMRGAPAWLVMPENSPRVKVDAVRGYGGEVVFCAPTLHARETTLAEVVARTGAAFIHPYNDHRIIAGQSTAAQEFLADVPDLDVLMTPVGGGGLTSGTALAAAYFSPGLRVIAAEPAQADDACRSFKAGCIIPIEHPDTIADGLRTSLGTLTFAVISRHVTDIVTCSEESIVTAMRLIWERMKLVVEPSAAVPLAAILEHRPFVEGLRVGVILSGGNVDLNSLPWRR